MKNINFIIFIVLVISALILSLYLMNLLYSGNSQILSSKNINSSEVMVYDSQCSSCSNILPNAMRYLLKEDYNFSPQNISVFLGTTEGNQIIENDDITSLPSIVIPISVMNEAPSPSRALFISALMYDNILTLNIDQNKLILNTPYSSILFGPIRYFSPVQNRTITSISIFNVSEVYRNASNQTIENFVNPISVLEEINATNLTYDNKPEIMVIYGNSPFSGMQTLILRQALLNFGKFQNNVTYFSSVYNITNSMALGPQLTYNLGAANYSSKFFELMPYSINDISNPEAEKVTIQYDQNLFFFYNSSSFGNFEPLIDIGGKYIIVSSFLKPFIFNGLNQEQINEKLDKNSTISQLFNNTVLFMDALLCSYENESTICSNNIVRQDMMEIASINQA